MCLRRGTQLPGPAECAGQAADPEKLLHGEENDLPRTLKTHTHTQKTCRRVIGTGIQSTSLSSIMTDVLSNSVSVLV